MWWVLSKFSAMRNTHIQFLGTLTRCVATSVVLLEFLCLFFIAVCVLPDGKILVCPILLLGWRCLLRPLTSFSFLDALDEGSQEPGPL